MKTHFFRQVLDKKVVGFAILIWLLFTINLKQVGQILYSVTIPFLSAAVLLVTAHVLMKFLRYQYILSSQGVQVSYLKTMHYCLAAIYLSFITPGRLGELSKSYFIHKDTGVALSRLFAGSVLDRLFDVYILFITAVLGIAFSHVLGPNSNVIAIALMIPVTLPLLLYFSGIRAAILTVLKHLPLNKLQGYGWFRHIQSFFDEFRVLYNAKILVSFLVTIGAYLLFYGSCFMAAQSVSIPLSYQKVAFFIACANILSFLPISFAGIGTREASLVYFFSIEGLSSESALAFSVLIFILTYLLFGILGFISFMTLDYSRKEVLDNA